MDILNRHMLSIIVLLPMIATAIFACVPQKYLRYAKFGSAFIMATRFFLSLVVFLLVDKTGEFDFIEKLSWVRSIGSEYFIAVDSASALMLLATTVIALCASVLAISRNDEQGKADLAISTIVFSAISIVVVSIDAMLYATSVAALVFIVFILSGRKASLKSGGALLVLSVLAVVSVQFYAGTKAGSFNVLSIYAHRFLVSEELFLFLTSALAVAILSGVFPFHGVTRSMLKGSPAATGGVCASALMLAGFYGAYRFTLTAYPVSATYFSETAMIYLAVASLLSLFGAMSFRSGSQLLSGIVSAQAAIALFGLCSQSATATAGSLIYVSTVVVAFVPVAHLAKRFFIQRGENVEASANVGNGKMLSVVSLSMSSSVVGTGMFAGLFYIFLGTFQVYPAVAIAVMAIVAFMTSVVFYSVWKLFYSEKRSEQEASGLSFSECAAISMTIFFIFYAGVFPRWMSVRISQSAEAFASLTSRTKSIMLVPSVNSGSEKISGSAPQVENKGE